MFKNTNEMPDLNYLRDFIEKPSQNCTDNDLTRGIDIVLIVLKKNPLDLMNIISNHPHIAATYLLSDLVEKMKQKACIEKLDPLFQTCFDELMKQCIYNVFDLKRFIEAAPNYTDKVMKSILSNESQLQRFFENSGNPDELLEEIGKNYPDYKSQFSNYYDTCANKHSSAI